MAKSTVKRIRNKSLQKDLAKLVEEMREDMARRHSPEFRQQERERAEKERRKEYIRLAMAAGFSVTQATFLYENLADIHHEHWDGRIGGGD